MLYGILSLLFGFVWWHSLLADYLMEESTGLASDVKEVWV